MTRKPVTIAELESATHMVHCMYGAVIRLNKIWRVLDQCGIAPAWGRRIGEPGTFGTCTSVDYSEANLEEGLRLVRAEIAKRERRNAKARARRMHRKTTLFAKAD